MSKKTTTPEDVFLKDIKDLVRNLLIDNPNYDNGHYYKDTTVFNTIQLIKDTKERAKYILERIDALEHLVKDFPDEPKGVLQLSDKDKDALKVSLVTKDDIVFKRSKLESLDFTRSSARVDVWICKSDGDHSFAITKDQAKILAAWLNLSSE